MCHTFLASLQQIFQNPLDDFHTQWYFSCKSHCSCGLVWTFPQDVVVFILNTASPWIIPERSTAPQHTRFILPPFHPTKSSLRCVGGIFLLGSCTLKISWADRTWYRLFVNAAAKQGQELRSEQTVIPLHEQGSFTYFLRLNNSETITQKRFWAQR